MAKNEEKINPQPIGNFIKWLSRTIVVIYGVVQVIEQAWDHLFPNV